MMQIVFQCHLTKLLSYIDIQRLCLIAAKNNRKADITGFMVECGGVFLVSLEGEDQNVKGMLGRIMQEPHYQNVVVVCSEDGIDHRRFGAWAMNVIFLDDDMFWNEVFGSSFAYDQMLSPRKMEPAYALGLLGLAYRYACAQAKIPPSRTGNRGGRIPRAGHMFRR